MAELRIEGAEKLARVSKALRHAGDKELAKEFRAGLTRAVKPMKAAAKKSALSTLPARGGLAKRVSKTTMPTKRRGGARNPGLRVTAKPNAVADPMRMDRGRIKHPVWGRGPWVLQNVKPGWFTKPMEDSAEEVREELVKALDTVAAKIVRDSQ